MSENKRHSFLRPLGRGSIATALISVLCFPTPLSAQQSPAAMVSSGLIVDLNADMGITENSGLVSEWKNSANYPAAPYFEKNDTGRAGVCQGCPSLRKKVKEINGHSTIVFREDELLNHNEDAFDHLTSGKGYTFFCVMSVFEQDGKLKDVNALFGNLKNRANNEGFWAGLTDSNRVWIGSRNGITFGRWDANNPFIAVGKPLQTGRYYLVMGRMGAGQGTVPIDIFINTTTPAVSGKFIVNPNSNASKLSIGQERNAIEHPGVESFDGEIAPADV